MTRRCLAIAHALLGTGLVFVAVWLDDRTGREALLGWTAWAVMVACWVGALLAQRRKTAELRARCALPVPRTQEVFVPLLIVFEIVCFASMTVPAMGRVSIPLVMFFISLGVAITTAIAGICFLVLGIPFARRLWLGVLLIQGVCLVALGIATLFVRGAGG